MANHEPIATTAPAIRLAASNEPPALAAAQAAFAPNGPFAALAEPALLLDGVDAIEANACGRAVAGDPAALKELLTLARTARRTRTATRRIMAVEMEDRDALLEFDVAPWGDALALALGRDVTVATGDREALQISRERYRTLLHLAVDCVWEIGPDGAFELLAPNVIFGRPAASLIGAPFRSLFSCGVSGFQFGRRPKEWTAAGLNAAGGATIMGMAIAEAMVDPDTGRIRGARGCFRQTMREHHLVTAD